MKHVSLLVIAVVLSAYASAETKVARSMVSWPTSQTTARLPFTTADKAVPLETAKPEFPPVDAGATLDCGRDATPEIARSTPDCG